MTNKIPMLAIALLMVCATFTSCAIGSGMGDIRDRNLEKAMLLRLDSVPNVEYIGMSDVHDIVDNGLRGCRAVIIYQIIDTAGNKIEYNARVTTNDDCSEILSWENLDSHVLGELKQKFSDKMNEESIDLDGSLIDAIIKLKKLSR